MGNHAGSYRMFRRADLAEERALGRLALTFQDVAAAAGRIGATVHIGYAVFLAGVTDSESGPQLLTRLGDDA